MKARQRTDPLPFGMSELHVERGFLSKPDLQFSLIVVVLLVIAIVGMGFLLAWSILVELWWLTIVAGAFLALTIVMGLLAFTAPDKMQSIATERTLKSASSTLGFVRHGLNAAGCKAVCELLIELTRAEAVAITDTQEILAYVGVREPGLPTSGPIRTQATREVLMSGKSRTFSSISPTRLQDMDSMDAVERVKEVAFRPAGIVSPLKIRDATVGVIKFYYHNFRDIDRTEHAVAEGFAELLSTQLALSELDRQEHLATEAEVRALQAQINPHFLFNTINTIAALIRTDPYQARELLREFAVFYRQTLENSKGLIPLSRELEQTRRYLTIEYARFGSARIREAESMEEGLGEVLVPAFVVQPLVENAVRHAMRERGVLHIDIHVTTENERDLLIAVADDGAGMEPEQVTKLLAEIEEPLGVTTPGVSDGTGTALRNVRERISKQFGAGSGVDVLSRPNEGTVVTLKLVGAVRPTPPSQPAPPPLASRSQPQNP